MHIIECHLSKPTWWAVKRLDRPCCVLRSLPGLAVVNPLLHQRLRIRGGIGSDRHEQIASTESIAYVRSSHLFFVSFGGSSLLNDPKSFSEGVQRFLQRLRLITCQPSLSKSIEAFSIWEGGDALPVRAPRLPRPTGWHLRAHVAEWAATSLDILAADSAVDQPVPVARDLLVDAVEAASDGDYRRALLYAAMAIEVLAGAAIDWQYQQALETSPTPEHLRICEYAPGGGALQRMDPIFVHLRKRGQLATLLHELPLYILGRSLAVEDRALFQKGLLLYRTRNTIAHVGQPPAHPSEYLPLSSDGAEQGLDIAFAIFRWFGEKGRFVNPLTRAWLQWP